MKLFAMVRADGVVDHLVTVIKGVPSTPDKLLAVAVPFDAPHPVCRGWTYADGVFSSPARENGFGAGEETVRAAKAAP